MMHCFALVAFLGAYCLLVNADCYPGDPQYSAIVQEINNEVTTDSINGLWGYGTLTRSQLCSLLVINHNSGQIQSTGQTSTNSNFLGQTISQSTCINALVNPTGYNTDNGWKKWAGHHSGTWWSLSQSFSDNAKWDQPYYKNGQSYAVQKVEFLSQWRQDNCNYVDITGSTCKFGWNQSGNGINGVWGWDPKNNDCPSGAARGRTGAVAGYTFSEGNVSCIVWVTTEEAFLECVRSFQSYKKRTSCTHDGGGYGQWYIT